MKRLCKAALLWSVILFIPSQAVAWTRVEHAVIARIAWENMTPQTRDAVIRLLHRAPPDSTVETYIPLDIRDPYVRQREFFVRISIWPDMMKDPGAEERRRKYACLQWHFTEFPFAEPGVTIPDIPAFTQRQVNIVERLQFFNAALIDPAEPVSNQAIEVAWTIHLVADIHVPLHVTSRVTAQEPEGDRGGNMFRLGNVNLHSYWDRIITALMPRRPNESETTYTRRIADSIMTEHPRDKMESRLKPGDYAAWAQESFDLARTVVYPGVERFKNPSPAYAERALRTARSQIALAGYRLAQMLNGVFAVRERRPATASASEVQNIKVRLDYDLACVAATLDEKVKDLKVVRGTVTEGTGAGRLVEGYDPAQVNEIVGATRNELLKTLAGEELAGMRAYVEKHFPTGTGLELLRIANGGAAASLTPLRLNQHVFVNHVRRTTAQTTSIVTTFSVGGVINGIRSFIGSLRRRSGPIKLTIITTPVQGANMTLRARGGKPYSQSTNSDISGFWPGTYTIFVTRQGYIDIVHPNVDLGFDNSIVECQLVTSGTQIFCQFR